MSKDKPSLLRLAASFFKIGCFAYGGWSGAMLMARRELIEKHHWISEEELARSLTYSQLLPGSTAVGIISGSGYRILGWPGLVVATVMYILPPTILMILLSAVYFRYHTIPSLGAPLSGVYAALTGILVANAWQLAKKYNNMWFLWVISITALVANVLLHISFAPIVISAAIIYLIFSFVGNPSKGTL